MTLPYSPYATELLVPKGEEHGHGAEVAHADLCDAHGRLGLNSTAMLSAISRNIFTRDRQNGLRASSIRLYVATFLWLYIGNLLDVTFGIEDRS